MTTWRTLTATRRERGPKSVHQARGDPATTALAASTSTAGGYTTAETAGSADLVGNLRQKAPTTPAISAPWRPRLRSESFVAIDGHPIHSIVIYVCSARRNASIDAVLR